MPSATYCCFLEGMYRGNWRISSAAPDGRGRRGDASFEEAASLRDLLHTVRGKYGTEAKNMASAEAMHMDIYVLCRTSAGRGELVPSARGRSSIAASSSGRIRRISIPSEFFQASSKRFIWSSSMIRVIHVPADFEDREALEEVSIRESRTQGRDRHASTGPKEGHARLVETNAKHGFDQRFRVLKPTPEAIDGSSGRPEFAESRRRIECFDISHIQGTTRSRAWWSGKTAG